MQNQQPPKHRIWAASHVSNSPMSEVDRPSVIYSWARWSAVAREGRRGVFFRAPVWAQRIWYLVCVCLPKFPSVQTMLPTVKEVVASPRLVEGVELCSGRQHFWQIQYWVPATRTTGPVHQFAAYQLCWLCGTDYQ